MSASPRYPRHLAQRRQRIVRVTEDVEAGDELKPKTTSNGQPATAATPIAS